MEFDLEVISEESDCPDPLFDSIMNAMNSMKEATADKIYQKIQRDGETNYSKPQVDRALANALKYGIFEVRNNRYRVRDDIIDDEDTVYWKLQKKREQTPFRIQDDNEKPFAPKMDPEKDNLRFKRLPDTEENKCPQCGRVKRPAERNKGDKKSKPAKKPKMNDKSMKRKRGSRNQSSGKSQGAREPELMDDIEDCKELKRETRSDSFSEERRIEGYLKTNHMNNPFDQRYFSPFSKEKTDDTAEQDRGKYDSSDSEADSLSSLSDDEQSFQSYPEGKKQKLRCTFYSSDCEELDPLENNIMEGKRSSTSIKSETESAETDLTSMSASDSPSKTHDAFFENLPCTSKTACTRERNQFSPKTPDLYSSKEYVGSQAGQCEEKTDWLGCSEEPQGAIIQTNNILTIEPMDSLAFKSPEEASYIS